MNETLFLYETGRRKGYGGALWATGSLAAVGMAALAALSGKAMMTSMLALMMAGVSALKNGKGDSNGCHTAHVIDAIHGRAIELGKSTAINPVEVSRADGAQLSASSNLDLRNTFISQNSTIINRNRN